MVAALARREREGSVAPIDLERAYSSVRLLSRAWHEILPPEMIRRTAERPLRMHPLRASGSLQSISTPVTLGNPSLRRALLSRGGSGATTPIYGVTQQVPTGSTVEAPTLILGAVAVQHLPIVYPDVPIIRT